MRDLGGGGGGGVKNVSFRFSDKHKLLYNLDLFCLTPSCLRGGPGGDRDPGRWGKRETIPNTIQPPPE